MTNTTNAATEKAIWFDRAQRERTERRLHELSIDLRHRAESGEISDEEANVEYVRTADRWMAE